MEGRLEPQGVYTFWRKLSTAVTWERGWVSNSRFLMSCDPDRVCKISLVELSLYGREGGTGLFKQRQGAIVELDVRRLVRRHGVAQFLGQLVSWECGQAAVVGVYLPASAILSSRSSSALVPMQVEGGANMKWAKVVEDILQISPLGADSEDSRCVVDCTTGCLRSSLGTADIDMDVIRDMVAAGVLLLSSSEFGEAVVRVNPDAVVWQAGSGLSIGTTFVAAHLSPSNLAAKSKLSAMMFMHSAGWRPASRRLAGCFYEHGGQKEYEQLLNRPKSYFVALGLADQILRKLGTSDAALPVLYHGMPDAYYRVLLNLKDARQVDALQDLLDGSPDIKALREAEFSSLLSSVPETASAADGGDDNQDDAPLALEWGPANPADLERAHRIASAVLRGLPSASVDLRQCFAAGAQGRRIKVHFDNCSHSSGKQRAYVACPSPHHKACFKYSLVEKFETAESGVAWLAAWAEHARDQPAAFTKAAHMRLQPSAASVAAMLRTVQEEAA